MHKPPPLIPPLLVPGHSLPLPLFPSRVLEGLLLFHPLSQPTLPIAKTSFCNLLFPFFPPLSRVFQLSSLFDSPSCPLGFFAPLRPSAVCPESWFHGYRISILGKPTRDPSTSDCLTPLINLVESLGEDFGCSFPPFPARGTRLARVSIGVGILLRFGEILFTRRVDYFEWRAFRGQERFESVFILRDFKRFIFTASKRLCCSLNTHIRFEFLNFFLNLNIDGFKY